MVQHFFRVQQLWSAKTIDDRWWTTEEHNKFLEAMELYPSGPWKKITRHVESRASHQVMTHAQKYRQRIKRRGNRKSRTENKSDSTTENLKIVGDEELELWETLLQQEVVQLEPLPLWPVCEISRQFTQELSVTDSLLLDELQQLIAPVTGDVMLETGNLDGNELLELLIDPMVD